MFRRSFRFRLTASRGFSRKKFRRLPFYSITRQPESKAQKKTENDILHRPETTAIYGFAPVTRAAAARRDLSVR